MAYAVAVRQFFNWCEQRALRLEAIRPTTVAAYTKLLGADMAKPSVKQHLRLFVSCSTTWSRAAYYSRIPPEPCAAPNMWLCLEDFMSSELRMRFA